MWDNRPGNKEETIDESDKFKQFFDWSLLPLLSDCLRARESWNSGPAALAHPVVALRQSEIRGRREHSKSNLNESYSPRVSS